MTGRRPTDFRQRNRADWTELEDLTGRVLSKGVFRENGELPTLMRLHRRVASSLAIARAMVVEQGVLRYLEALATRSHLALYGSTRPMQQSAARFLADRIPRAVRALRVELAIALGVLVLGVVIGWALVLLEPAWFFSMVDPDWIGLGSAADRTSTLRDRLAVGALQSPQTLDLAFAGLMAFTLAVAVGIPTVTVVFSTGLGLGASFGLYAERGLLAEFAGWFLPHGLPAVIAVVLCAGAGLALARAIVFPKFGRASVGLAARQAAPLLVAAAALFGVSLCVELFVDPPGKLGPALVFLEAALIGLWLGLGRGKVDDPQRTPAPPRARAEHNGGEVCLCFDGPEISGLRVHLASFGERCVALGLDLLFIGLAYMACVAVFDLPANDWVLVVVIGFVARHAYFVVFECRWQGATPGKRLMGLRVMARDGRGLDMRSIFVRNLLRDAELVALTLLGGLLHELRPHSPLPEAWLPIVTGTAVIFIYPVLSRERQRLGDYIADTIVIRVPAIHRPPEEALEPGGADADFTREQLSVYGAREFEVLADLLAGLVVESESASRVASEVAQAIAERVGVDSRTVAEDPERFLRRFYRAQRSHLERERMRGRMPC